MSKFKRKRTTKSRRGITEKSIYFEEFDRFTRKVRAGIQRLRKERGLTQEQMEEFEINLRQFQRIESGETKNITLSNLFKIAKAFKCSMRDLIPKT